MRGRKRRLALAVLAIGALVFVAVGGPAAAKHFIDGSTIKPGTVGNKQLAKGAVSSSKLSKSLLRSLKGKAGANGATGAQGSQGPKGDRGAPGAFNVVDASGHVVGPFVGTYAGQYIEALVNGVIYVWDNSPTNANVFGGLVLYYKVAGCDGTPYLPALLPPQMAWTLEASGGPGTNAYVVVPGSTFENFSYLSHRTSAGCTDNAATAITNVLPAQIGGQVPSAQKPLEVVPAS
jgi:hypothetical protein